MRSFLGISAALVSGSVGLLVMAAPLGAQVVNPDFELPNDGASGTDGVATAWTLNPAVGDNYTNPGARCQFDTPTPSGGTWSLWLQTFVQYGSATQVVPVSPSTNYDFSADMAFQTPGYDNITLANQAPDPKTMDTGDCYSYLAVQFLNNHGININGAYDELDIPAGGLPGGYVSGSWILENLTAMAPSNAASAELIIGWQNGGLDGNTGSQSAFATGAGLAPVAVPEPATFSVLGLGGMALLARRRNRSA